MRLDQYLCEKNLYNSRNQASEVIKKGNIKVNNSICLKPSKKVSENDKIEIINKSQNVGRAGKKLEEALKEFKIDVKNLTAIDIGAGAGAFSEVLLKKGVNKIYAIDVGSDQMKEKIKTHPRVINMEKTHILEVEKLDEKAQIAVIDLSHISLKKVIKHIFTLLEENSSAIALFKPQFECESGKQLDKGVLKDELLREKLLTEFKTWLKKSNFVIKNTIQSPITGKKGNIEYLLEIKKGG